MGELSSWVQLSTLIPHLIQPSKKVTFISIFIKFIHRRYYNGNWFLIIVIYYR